MNSRIILAKGIKLDRNYNNVVNYTENQMLTLLRSEGHFVKEKTDYSFIRGTGQIDTQFTYSEVLGANYMAFQNPDYSNKWFFAWIDEVQYRGNYNTRIIYTIDAWSTWFSDWTAKKCFINRHHVNDDTIGLHTIPENLDVGEIEEIDMQEDSSYTYRNYIAIECSYDIYAQKQRSGISVYNGTVFGNQIYVIPITQLSDFANIYTFMNILLYDNQSIDNIQNIFFIPDALLKPAYMTQRVVTRGSSITCTYYELLYNNETAEITHTYAKPYTNTNIKNNKCFVYPYNYLFVSNNAGNYNIYKYEDFSGQNVTFSGHLAMSIGVSGRLVPTNYKGMAQDDDEAIALAKYPVCAWSSDAFTNWLTQNAVNIATDVAFGIVGAGSNSMSKNQNVDTGKAGGQATGVALGLNVAKTIANEIGQFYTASLLPNIQGGQPVGDINFLSKRNTFTFRFMRSKAEYLKIIDDYFTRFGYAIKSLEMPNITGRTYWNYVEIGEQEEIGYGDVPHNFMDIINNACRKGVTIWHNHENIGNWDLNNEIINE